MPTVGFEPTISARERPKTYALDRAATGAGFLTIDACYVSNTKLMPYVLEHKLCWLAFRIVQYCNKTILRFQATQCGFRGGLGKGFLLVPRISLVSIIPPALYFHTFISLTDTTQS